MRVRKAVFPAAGWGTRFLPATKAQPKEMLPLVDKPIIQYAVEEAVAAGIEVPEEDTHRYGVIAGEEVQGALNHGRLHKVSRLVEKPTPGEAPSNLAII